MMTSMTTLRLDCASTAEAERMRTWFAGSRFVSVSDPTEDRAYLPTDSVLVSASFGLDLGVPLSADSSRIIPTPVELRERGLPSLMIIGPAGPAGPAEVPESRARAAAHARSILAAVAEWNRDTNRAPISRIVSVPDWIVDQSLGPGAAEIIEAAFESSEARSTNQ